MSGKVRTPGAMKGRIKMAPDFGEWPEDILAAFYAPIEDSAQLPFGTAGSERRNSMTIITKDVRDHLQDIFCKADDENFCEEWKIFSARGDHSVLLKEDALSTQIRQFRIFINCYSFAFGLHAFASYIRFLREVQSRTQAGTTSPTGHFIKRLISDGALKECDMNQSAINSIVIYFEDDLPVHCGVVGPDRLRITSKFGGSEIFEHGLMEIPRTYGNCVRYFENISNKVKEKIIQTLVDQAKPA